MTKVAVSEALMRVADRCVQVMGGTGVTGDTIVEQVFREIAPSASMTGRPRSTNGASPRNQAGMEGRTVTYQYITVAREDRLTIVTINRPEAHNALNTVAHEELAAAFDAFAADPDQWVAIITGAGEKAFCAGHDLKQQASGGGMATPSSGFGGLTARFDMAKPVIAAVNGVAMGAGSRSCWPATSWSQARAGRLCPAGTEGRAGGVGGRVAAPAAGLSV